MKSPYSELSCGAWGEARAPRVLIRMSMLCWPTSQVFVRRIVLMHDIAVPNSSTAVVVCAFSQILINMSLFSVNAALSSGVRVLMSICSICNLVAPIAWIASVNNLFDISRLTSGLAELIRRFSMFDARRRFRGEVLSSSKLDTRWVTSLISVETGSTAIVSANPAFFMLAALLSLRRRVCISFCSRLFSFCANVMPI